MNTLSKMAHALGAASAERQKLRPQRSASGLGRRPAIQRPAAMRGVAMLEVLIAIVISVVGVVGLIAMQMRAYQAESESYQRAQALVILEDLAARLTANGARAAEYVSDAIGADGVADCAGLASGATRDLCEVGNSLAGAGEKIGGSPVGAMAEGRACVTSTDTNTYVLSVVWAGVARTAAPATACGKDQYGDEGLRRAVTTVVVVARLGV